MKLNIIEIGNSKGIRLPKNVLKQCDINDQVDMEIENGKIILSASNSFSRKNWDEKFREMNRNQDDKLIIDDNIDLVMDNWQW